MTSKNKVGDKIREIRTLQNVSIEELATRSNLGVEQIQSIEKNEMIPSLAPLVQIARVFGVRIGTFLDDSEALGPVVTLADQRKSGMSFSNSNMNARSHMDFFALAAGKEGRSMEPFIIDVKPNEVKKTPLSYHEGEEFIFVLDGSIEILYGKEKYELHVGDSIYYDSIVSHSVSAIGVTAAKILAVVYIPV